LVLIPFFFSRGTLSSGHEILTSIKARMQKTDKSVFYHFGHKMFSSISMIFLRFENEFCEVEYKQGTIVETSQESTMDRNDRRNEIKYLKIMHEKFIYYQKDTFVSPHILCKTLLGCQHNSFLVYLYWLLCSIL